MLDNFEDNLLLGESGFIDPTTGPVLESLCRAAVRGKLILTCRYPIPGFDAWLARVDLGPLSSAQTRKLFYRLAGLKDQSPQILNRVLRGIGGHPRLLEFLDAILRGGEARLPIVEEKLRRIIEAQGLRIEDLGRDIDEAVGEAIRSGAKDILLEELLDIVSTVPGDRAILEQAAVFPLPIELDDLASALAGDSEPSSEEVRKVTERLVRTSLLTALGDGSVWVHRWTAETLKDRMEAAEHRESCRRAGEALLRRFDQKTPFLIEGIEAVRLLLQAESYDRAVAEAGSILQFMQRYGQASDLVAFSEEIVAKLPVGHRDFPSFLVIGADALASLGDTDAALERTRQAVEILEGRNLKEPSQVYFLRDLSVSYARMGDLFLSSGQSDSAKAFYEKDLAIAKRLARQEPDRADYQHDLSGSYERIGDLFLSLGQGESAKAFYEKSLASRERLAQQEPDRADFQRDLSVSYERMGDLLLSLGQDDSAKAFFKKDLAIAERLARQEPGRADFQRDLSVSFERMGDLFLSLGQGDSAKPFFEKSLAIRERLARQEPDRADFQRDLSVSYERMGDLLSLGQGDSAQTFYEKSLAIRERLARQEPGRADFQRDLSVSYQRMGDLLLPLGQSDSAKAFFEKSLAIREHLARQDPGRADFQTDLAVFLVRMVDFDVSERGAVLNRALAILKALDARGGLAPTQQGWIDVVEKMLADSD